MKQVTASGQTVEDAVQSALKQLNTTEDQVNVDIIDEGKKGLLGIFGSKPAIVKVSLVENPVKKAEMYLSNIVSDLGIDATIETIVKGNQLTFQLTGEKIAILIGKRGQTLNAVQYLLQLVVNRSSNQYYTVVLDAEGYRKRREETLVNLANRLAVKAVRSKRGVELEPMPSFERKVIHTALQNSKQVNTLSAGDEPNRHVVIKPKS
ncbi:RNA-binding cell elongation regulator Jag/EloR [Aquibacillus kalidii]|uniref:RNA-binding cell elongation regulator Jag/EloR n=1 Tax=Aquibacillus kalidii TaxID=2762597 RepID=UPI0016467814|nr:RNA-binding cell elongation regulator Jag/EloR [Aquibacillus kalidii]